MNRNEESSLPGITSVPRDHDEDWLASGKRRRSNSILHCCSLDKNSLSREPLGFLAVCFACDELINSIGLSGLHLTIRVPARPEPEGP